MVFQATLQRDTPALEWAMDSPPVAPAEEKGLERADAPGAVVYRLPLYCHGPAGPTAEAVLEELEMHVGRLRAQMFLQGLLARWPDEAFAFSGYLLKDDGQPKFPVAASGWYWKGIVWDFPTDAGHKTVCTMGMQWGPNSKTEEVHLKFPEFWEALHALPDCPYMRAVLRQHFATKQEGKLVTRPMAEALLGEVIPLAFQARLAAEALESVVPENQPTPFIRPRRL